MENRVKTGVFLCSCGGTLDLEPVREYFEGRAGLEVLGEHDALCSPLGREVLTGALSARRPERVLIGSCAPLRVEGAFRSVMRRVGLNPYLLALADMTARHPVEEAAMGLSRAGHLEPVDVHHQEPAHRRVLILGNGAGALETARELITDDIPVVVAGCGGEPDPALYLMDNRKDTQQPDTYLRELREQLAGSELVTIQDGAHLASFSGSTGSFRARLEAEDGTCVSQEFGAVVLATGCRRVFPQEEYGLEPGAGVYGLFDVRRRTGELEDAVPDGGGPLRIGIVLDAACEEHRLPFVAALEWAREARSRINCDVSIFLGQARVNAPGLDALYREARERGLVFVKYSRLGDLSRNPVPRSYMGEDERYFPQEIEFETERMEVPPRGVRKEGGGTYTAGLDVLVLAERLVPAGGADDLADLLGLKTGPGGYFQEDSVHLLPVLTSRRGIFVCGMASGPKAVAEIRDEAAGVARAVGDLLAGGRIRVDWNAAVVNSEQCALCLTCIRSCPHGAVVVNREDNAAQVQRVDCQGCGVCASECPAEAIQLEYFTDDQILSELDAVGGGA